MLILYPLTKLLWGAFVMACQVGFLSSDLIFNKNHHPAYRCQWIRSLFSREAAKIPHINNGVRKMLYRLSGIKIGKGGFIGMGNIFDDVHPENVVIEDNAVISFGVTIVAHGPKRTMKPDEKMIILRHDSYVGTGVLILPGVEIGHHASVGAGSVVTKSVPPGAVVAGCPAKILYYKEGFEPTETQSV
ncbi:MAG: acyltransferase [Clostridia bacterium]|nr:acyltransferase [Clostridia bacterium]